MSAAQVPRVLVLDNRDSFVFNLVDEFHSKGAEVATVRSDLSLKSLQKRLDHWDPDLVVLSPGPGRPEQAGVMVEWLVTEPDVPVLGVCLGHQALAVAAGGRVGPAPRPVHGRKSSIRVENDPVFKGLAPHFMAARYHSLVVTEPPPSMGVIATLVEEDQELVMALRHRTMCRLGLQFHPESILTSQGRQIVWRFLDEALQYRARRDERPIGDKDDL